MNLRLAMRVAGYVHPACRAGRTGPAPDHFGQCCQTGRLAQHSQHSPLAHREPVNVHKLFRIAGGKQDLHRRVGFLDMISGLIPGNATGHNKTGENPVDAWIFPQDFDSRRAMSRLTCVGYNWHPPWRPVQCLVSIKRPKNRALVILGDCRCPYRSHLGMFGQRTERADPRVGSLRRTRPNWRRNCRCEPDAERSLGLLTPRMNMHVAARVALQDFHRHVFMLLVTHPNPHKDATVLDLIGVVILVPLANPTRQQ